MKFLFVDTETSSLTPTKGQIIEIAGVLAELDPAALKLTIVDEFEQLVSFRGAELDERITRITGITEDDLKTADSLVKVQDNWADWLERWAHEEVFVVGHSVDFDLGFLNAENWFLPLDYKRLDTLELVKVLLPEVSAINLEFLVQRFGLSPQQKENRTTGELVAHRALYDTLCCIHLFELTLHKLKDLSATPEFYHTFLEFFGLHGIEFYGNGIEQDKIHEPLTLNKIYFDGSLVKPNLFQKISLLGTKEIQGTLHSVLESNLPTRLTLITLQLFVLNLMTAQGTTGLKFHGREQVDFAFFELLLDIVLNLDFKVPDEVTLEKFESIVSAVRPLSEKQFKLGRFMTLLEIYLKLDSSAAPVQKALSSYDFFLIAIQPFWVRSEYNYKPFDLSPDEQMIRTKLGQLSIQIKDLYEFNFNQSTIVLKNLVSKIKKYLEELQIGDDKLFISSNNMLQFRYYSHQVFVGQKNRNFRLNSALEQLITDHNPTITTNYGESDFWKFLEITGTKRVLENYPKIKYLGEGTELLLNLEEVSLKKFYQEKIEVAKSQNKPVLMLCGQNSGLRDSEKVMQAGGFDNKDYLILGDTGSLTKIASKLTNGFKGLVIVKVNDFDYFVRLGLIDYADIWLLSQPYFPLDSYWWKLAKISGNRDEFLKIFKFMYMKAIASKIHTKTQMQIKFQKGYHIKDI